MRRSPSRTWAESGRRIVESTAHSLRQRRRRTILVGIAVAAVVIAAGTTFAAWTHAMRTDAHQRSVQQELDDIELRLQGVVGRSTAALATAPAIVDGDVIDLDRFGVFARGLSHRPVVAVALALVVTADERAQFEREHGPILAPSGATDRASDVAPARDHYYPVVAVQPPDSSAATLLGLDIETDELRSEAVRDARDSGDAAITPVGILPYSPDPAIVVIQPLYRDGAQPATVDARRAGLVGLVSVSFSAQALLDDAAAGIHVLHGVSIGSGTAESDGVIERSFELAGTPWTLLADAGNGPSPAPSLAIGAATIAFAGLLLELVRRSWVHERDLARSAAVAAHHQHRTERLQQLSAELAAVSTSTEVASAIVAAAADLLDPAEVHLDVVDESGAVVAQLPDDPARAHDGTAIERDIDPDVDTVVDTDIDPDVDTVGRRSIPLRIDETLVGHLTVVSQPGTDVDPTMVRTLVDLSCQALLRARRYEADHRLVGALQTMLLPVVPRQIGNIALAATYRPVLRSSGVGGDWYDAFEVADGVAAVVGDVVGKGVRAAGAMGQLRIGSRTVGSRSTSIELLEALDELAEPPGAAFMATAAHVLIDTANGVVMSALAGHPPPLLLHADGTTEWLGGAPGPPLGVRPGGVPAKRHQVVAELRCPCRILLYTDGLVERRGETIDVGLERLEAAARGAAALDLDAFLQQVIDVASPPDGATDDVAALCLGIE